ncbi:MAG TPA: AAA family ATPase [Steroidobacteraceae bacterium]|nr:AAA family ATPase [Steroidobacteraceae bacterium]
MTHERFFVLTGGPGSGKSSLIDVLASAGYGRTIEAGRAIIQQQLAIDGPALPHKDPAAFAEMMLGWEMRSYHEASALPGIVFFDRGVPDIEGYLRLMQRPVPPHVSNAIQRYRYNRRVFIAPPWSEIFAQDAERKQTFDEAVRTYESLAQTYRNHDYELLTLPLAPVAARVRFMLDRLG